MPSKKIGFRYGPAVQRCPPASIRVAHRALVPALLCAALLVTACAGDPETPDEGETKTLACAQPPPVARAPAARIVLRWVPGYPEDSRAHAALAVRWGLSLLGARLDPERDAGALTWVGERHLEVSLSAAGFSAEALTALSRVAARLQASEAAQVTGGVDIGRFLMATLGTPAHYYAITGVPKTWQAFVARHGPLSERVHVLDSVVAKHHRRLRGVDAACATQIAWIADEGPGDLVAGSFETRELETLDVMPNGQPRYAVYGIDGGLRPWGDPALGSAGKPARCAFCHEGGVEPLWIDAPTGPGGLSRADFNALRERQMGLLARHRFDHPSQAPLDVPDAHGIMEIAMAAFLEPSAARLAAEWRLPEATIRARLAHLPTHRETLYRAWLAPSYRRRDVAPYAPWQAAQVPVSPYLPGPSEPNWLAP